MFIVDITYTVDLAIIDKYLAEHRSYLETKYQDGMLLCSGPKTPRTGGVVIALYKTLAEVESFIKHDPYNKYGVASYTISEFTPVKYHEVIKEIIA